ncbi:anti-sigma factor [Winogradskyella vincentii]|uniref:Anti-sigma factor n=1 Tax=Winogradskyella vincentii TaxID=2877122 RepID=A0ABS7Y0X4_9FLAO|nr:anti-sigma factor [Winogradskyella vincentii]MCA0153574.1 anti-sigma factor [Winogradskyella vincentii]
MDKKKLLDNGLLEQYLLGELNADQCNEIEKLLASDPELKAKYDLLEQDFESMGLENAIEPPVEVKSNILKLVSKTTIPKAKVIKLYSGGNDKYYLGIAASVAGLLLVGSIWMFSQLSEVKQQLNTVESTNSELNNTIDKLNKELNSNTTLYATLSHPDTEQYILKGNTLMPEGKVVSYVNHTTKSVVINAEKLPDLDAEHDYQMWADVEGEMINMGVISKDKNLLAMNYIDHAESLNITIEPAGGNDHPTVSRLVTNIYLN